MNKFELQEAASIAQRVLTQLYASTPLAAVPPLLLPKFQWSTKYLRANASSQISYSPSPFNVNLALCFELARYAGATYQSMDAVRALTVLMAPRYPTGIAIAKLSVNLALMEEARILAATTFTNRQEIDNYIDQAEAVFSAAEEVAADDMETATYTTLIQVHSAVIADLSARAQPLPEIVSVTFPIRQPAFTLAQTIYKDGSRADELVVENYVVHPLFMPTQLNVLAD